MPSSTSANAVVYRGTIHKAPSLNDPDASALSPGEVSGWNPREEAIIILGITD